MDLRQLWVRIRQALLLALMFCAPVLAQQDDAFELVPLPDFMLEKVADIDDEKVEFLRGSGIFQFAGLARTTVSALQEQVAPGS